MSLQVSKNKLTLISKGYSRVNELDSPELLQDSDLAILENYVLDQVAGVPQVRFGFTSYNANALGATPTVLSDTELGGSDYIIGVDGTSFRSSLNGTGAWVNQKTGLTSSKIVRVCQYSNELYVTNGYDAPFVTALGGSSNGLSVAAPDTSSTTITANTTGGSMAIGKYYYAFVYKDGNGNYSAPSSLFSANITTNTGSVTWGTLPTSNTLYVYRTQAGGTTFYLLTILSGGTLFVDTYADTGLDTSQIIPLTLPPATAFYPLIKNDRLFFANIALTPISFPSFPYGYSGLGTQTNYQGTAGLTASSTYKYAITFVFTDGSESALSRTYTYTTPASMGGDGTIWLAIALTGPTELLQMSGVQGIKIYRTVAGGSTFYANQYYGVGGFVISSSYFSEGAVTSIVDHTADSTLGSGSYTAYSAPSQTTYNSRIVFSNNGAVSTFDSLDFIDVYPDDGDQITGILDDGDGILIFKTNNIYKLFTVGAPSNWQLELMVRGIGCTDPNTLVQTAKGIFFKYRSRIYAYASGSLPQDVSAYYQTTIGSVTSFFPSFYHAPYEWVVFPGIYSSNAYLIVYDTKNQTWYRLTTGTSSSSFSAFSRKFGNDAGLLIYSVNTTLGKYDSSANVGSDGYPSVAATTSQVRTKTFAFPNGIPLARPRFLWIDQRMYTGGTLTHTLNSPDTGASSTYSQTTSTFAGTTKLITDAMTTPIASLTKVYYDITGTKQLQFRGFQFKATILRRGQLV